MNQLWETWDIDLDDSDARNYAAGQIDEDVNALIKVTTGKNILRVEASATAAQVPILGQLHARWTGCVSVLTYINARMYLEYVLPYLTCRKRQALYALKAWCDLNEAKSAYRKFVIETARGMPGAVC